MVDGPDQQLSTLNPECSTSRPDPLAHARGYAATVGQADGRQSDGGRWTVFGKAEMLKGGKAERGSTDDGPRDHGPRRKRRGYEDEPAR